MNIEETLIFGLLDTSESIAAPRVAARLRDLTLSWTRYGYHGDVIEDSTVEGILDRACEAGFKYCLIQAYGHIISEDWSPGHWGVKDFHEAVADRINREDFFVTGFLVGSSTVEWGLDPSCLLVDLEKYDELGRPHFDLDDSAQIGVRPEPGPSTLYCSAAPRWLEPSAQETSDRRDGTSPLPGRGFIEAGLRHSWKVYNFDDTVLSHSIQLYPADPVAREEFANCLGEGIFAYRAQERLGLTSGQRRFLDGIERQAHGAKHGVFPWNIESYRDVIEAAADFAGPVSTLYCVAAGLKPNMILHSHAIDRRTRVVYFDYSPDALEFRRRMLSQWDGMDYPRFIRNIFEQMPAPQTFYHLWSHASPDCVDGRDLDQMWAAELRQWGGADVFQKHWHDYRQLEHEFICGDLVNDPQKVFDRMTDESRAVVWWSNAFFTVHSNWFYSVEERRRRYEAWVHGLAKYCPRASLYGADYNNISVNAVQAAAYAESYSQGDGDVLKPFKVQRCQIRS